MPTMWPCFLEDFHNVKLVFREHLGESIRVLDRLCQRSLSWSSWPETTGVEDVCAHP